MSRAREGELSSMENVRLKPMSSTKIPVLGMRSVIQFSIVLARRTTSFLVCGLGRDGSNRNVWRLLEVVGGNGYEGIGILPVYTGSMTVQDR